MPSAVVRIETEIARQAANKTFPVMPFVERKQKTAKSCSLTEPDFYTTVNASIILSFLFKAKEHLLGLSF